MMATSSHEERTSTSTPRMEPMRSVPGGYRRAVLVRTCVRGCSLLTHVPTLARPGLSAPPPTVCLMEAVPEVPQEAKR